MVSLQRFLGQGEVLVVSWGWYGFVWNMVSKQQYLVPDFQQRHSSPVLEMCPRFLLLTFFPSQLALTLVALNTVGIQAEFEVYDLMGMCNLALRMNMNFFFLLHMLTFSNIFVKHCVFTSKALLIFEGRFDLCSVLQFVQLGKRSCKFIIVALLLHNKFLADTVIYFNMLCNHF